MNAIPKLASLTSASINLYSAKTATNVTKVEVMDMTKAWNSSVTWNRAKTGDSWREGAKDSFKALVPTASVSTAERGSQAGPWEFSGSGILDMVEGWRLGRGEPNNDGFMLKLPDEAPYSCCFERRAEWESSAGTKKPYLSVQYILPAPPKSRMASPTDGTTTAKRFRLVAAWEEPIVEGVTFQYKTSNSWSDIPTSQVIDEDGQSVSWPLKVPDVDDRESEPLYWDASSLHSEAGTAKVKIRAVMKGSPGASGYTKPVAGVVDQDIGGAKDATASVGPGSVDLLTGNFTVSRTDVSISGFESALLFSRSHSSRDINDKSGAGVLGAGWSPSAPVEGAGSAWRSLKIESESEEVEEVVTINKWATLTHSDGHQITFPINAEGAFLPSTDAPGSVVYRLSESQIAFTEPDGTKTIFSNSWYTKPGFPPQEYLPISVSRPSGPESKTRLVYVFSEEKALLKRVIASTDDDIVCTDEGASLTKGCRGIEFTYENANTWGGEERLGWRLARINFFAPGLTASTTVASYAYDSSGRLVAAKDPRTNLQETYSYESGGQLKTITPPGQEPWTMSYGKLPGDTTSGRLLSVKRPSLVASTPTAQTTIAYGVPMGPSPYNMSLQEISKWGQEDLPVDATAIFPPDEVPSSPPSGYGHATVYYMDGEGQTVNVASPAAPGAAGPSISTMETDEHGNVSRELTPENRLRALAEGAGSVGKSKELDTQFKYSADGAVMVDERGPVHPVRLETGPEAGSVVEARRYRSIQYDAGAPEPKAGEAWPLLPTSETTGALVAGEVLDRHSTTFRYDWQLRQAIETIRDPEGLKIRSVTKYESEFGQVAETRQPKDAESPGAGSTKVSYYNWRSGYESESASECHSRVYAGLPCRIYPAGQPASGPNRPTIHYVSYSALGKPIEVVEETTGSTPGTRTRTNTYDIAGRLIGTKAVGGGVQVPKVEIVYAASNGLPVTQRFVCPLAEPSCDKEAVTKTYDGLGRPIVYQDADGGEAKTTYDVDGRPATFSDGKGSQIYTYHPASGALTTISDSMAGTFTAKYNANGQLVQQKLPNGLTAEAVFDAAGLPTDLTYTKASNCGTSCTWLDFEVSRAVDGKIVSEAGTLGTEQFTYDRLGRLTQAQEIPAGSGCTTRTYAYDDNSNRQSLITRPPGPGGICTESGGSSQAYSYDEADRLQEAGLSYDAFGRTTSLPGDFASGSTLETSYFSNDLVASQSQNGTSNTYQLDSALRHHQRVQNAGLEGTEVFHYASDSDAPAWTELGSTWSRSIPGISGDLAALAQSGGPTRLQLTNLHGDVVATADVSPVTGNFALTARYDEFGKPLSGTPTRFGWLGGAYRRSELPSGVIQMGARSYVPSIGRFLSTDPIAGGSANAYDYGNQDPINNLDLQGRKPYDYECFYKFGLCACKLEAELRKRKPGRLRWAWTRRCNQKGGITLTGWALGWWIGDGGGTFLRLDEAPKVAGPPVARGICGASEPCQSYQSFEGQIYCAEGWEYQAKITWGWTFNGVVGSGGDDEHQLDVAVQQFCPKKD
jgi:RHS repeat-associated protein